MDPPRKPRLSTEGQIFVSLAAGEQWLRANDHGGIEEARRDLTELLLDSYRVESDPDQVRRRRTSDRLDLQAWISREGRLLVVTRIHVRDYRPGGPPRRRIVR